jgi:hypothetical protein
MLYRTAAARSVLRAVSASNASVARSRLPTGFLKAQLTTSSRPSVFTRPTTLALAARKPVTTALVRYASVGISQSRKNHGVLRANTSVGCAKGDVERCGDRGCRYDGRCSERCGNYTFRFPFIYVGARKTVKKHRADDEMFPEL